MDELEFDEDATPTVAEDRVVYKASVSGFPVGAAAMNEALAKLWLGRTGPLNLLLVDRFDPLHVDARAHIEQKFKHVGLDENNEILLLPDDIHP